MLSHCQHLPLTRLCHNRQLLPSQTLRRAMGTSQLSEYASRQVDGRIIDFSVGQPSPSLLPLAKIHAAAVHRLDPGSESTLLLQYGPRQGYPSFRQSLADFLTSQYHGHAVHPAELMATAGVSQGLDLVTRCLSKPGDTILVEQPTYFLARGIFECNHLSIQGVATDVDGLDTAALEELLQQWPADRARPRLLYTIPVHNNPSASTLTQSRRQHLVRLAHQYDFTIIADEVYQLLTFPTSSAPPPPLRSFDVVRPGHQAGLGAGAAGAPNSHGAGSRVVSLGSFSKIMAPGLRLGWVEAGPGIMKLLVSDGAINSGGCIAPIACGIAHSALQMGLLQEHLEQCVKPALQAQCSALTSALRELMPGCSFHQPQGGYFLWLQLPDKVQDAKQLLSYVESNKLGVRFTPGFTCGGRPSCVRLCFAFYSGDELREGVARLAQAVDSFQ